MNVSICSRSVCQYRRFREYVVRRVRDAIGPFRGRVHTVSVRLSDTNGSRGGVDKQCRIEVQTTHGKVIRIRDVASDCASATARAVRRCAASLKRHMGRERGRRGKKGLGKVSVEWTFREDA